MCVNWKNGPYKYRSERRVHFNRFLLTFHYLNILSREQTYLTFYHFTLFVCLHFQGDWTVLLLTFLSCAAPFLFIYISEKKKMYFYSIFRSFSDKKKQNTQTNTNHTTFYGVHNRCDNRFLASVRVEAQKCCPSWHWFTPHACTNYWKVILYLTDPCVLKMCYKPISETYDMYLSKVCLFL